MELPRQQAKVSGRLRIGLSALAKVRSILSVAMVLGSVWKHSG